MLTGIERRIGLVQQFLGKRVGGRRAKVARCQAVGNSKSKHTNKLGKKDKKKGS